MLPERTAFVGRRPERELLLAEIRAGSRLLALTGPSGIGKTRLAGCALADVREALPHLRTLFCSALGCSGSADLQAAVGGALGVAQKHADNLGAVLAARGPTLLV